MALGLRGFRIAIGWLLDAKARLASDRLSCVTRNGWYMWGAALNREWDIYLALLFSPAAFMGPGGQGLLKAV